jgi:hypothetical protein
VKTPSTLIADGLAGIVRTGGRNRAWRAVSESIPIAAFFYRRLDGNWI